MPLFQHLHDDAFLVFSRAHKHLYEACLLDLHERFFTGAPSFPTPQQVVHAIYEVMRVNRPLWSEADDFAEGLPPTRQAQCSGNRSGPADRRKDTPRLSRRRGRRRIGTACRRLES